MVHPQPMGGLQRIAQLKQRDIGVLAHQLDQNAMMWRKFALTALGPGRGRIERRAPRDRPEAINAQNRRRSSRRATPGRPGERIPDRSSRSNSRFLLAMATCLYRVLRRPVETAQYCSHDYQKILREHGLSASMSGKGNCYDNAAVLRRENSPLDCFLILLTFFKTIKAELIWRRTWETRRQVETAIFQYVNGFYNPRRRHSALGWKSPVAFERKAA